MPKVKKLVAGDKYGRLTILGECERRPVGKKGEYHWFEKCKCDCGNITWVYKGFLKNGHTKSCGCLGDEHRAECGNINKKHGNWNTRLYRIFYDIKQRCTNPKHDRYYCYGDRGIKCLWETYEDFKKDMGEEYDNHVEEYGEKDTTIDRIDVNGNYCKENCRWATRKEQMTNTRRNRMEIREGKEMSITEIYNKANPVVCYSTFIARYYISGRDLKASLYTPLKHPRTNFNSIKNK